MQNKRHPNARTMIVLASFIGLVLAGCAHDSLAQILEPEQTPDAAQLPEPESIIAEAGTTGAPTPTGGAYLPLVVNDPTATPVTPVPTLAPTLQPSVPVTITGDSVFGVEMENVFTGGTLLANKGTTWVRRNALVWSAVEPIQGARNWSNVIALERELVEAARLNMKVILIVRSTPAWARKYTDSECGPVRSDRMAAFGKFMGDAVARYSKAPYNVKYFEIWNEPDAPVASGAPVWGCWGEHNDAYYGGRYYATALKAAYPLMKAANPEAQVLVGGLLANCDPARGGKCVQSKFFEGILVGGGAPYFDGLSYHTYDYYYAGSIGGFGTPNWPSAWNTTGPLLVVKSRFFKDVMRTYHVTDKYIINTELAVICDSCGTNGGGVVELVNVADTDGLVGGEVKVGEVLEQRSGGRVPACRIELVDADPVEPELAAAGLVEALDELDQRGLARPVLPDDRDRGTGRDGQVDVVEGVGIGPWVAIAQPLQLDAHSDPVAGVLARVSSAV